MSSNSLAAGGILVPAPVPKAEKGAKELPASLKGFPKKLYASGSVFKTPSESPGALAGSGRFRSAGPPVRLSPWSAGPLPTGTQGKRSGPKAARQGHSCVRFVTISSAFLKMLFSGT